MSSQSTRKTFFSLPWLVGLIYFCLFASSTFVSAEVLINELDADQNGVDTAEFVELYDGGIGNTSLNGLVLVFFSGLTDTRYAVFDLDGYTTNANGYFVLCGNAGNVPKCNLVVSQATLIQNGQDAVALYKGSDTDFPPTTAVTTNNLIDAIVYDTNDADDAGLLALLNSGQPQVNEDGGSNKDAHSNQRCPNGAGGTRNTDTYLQDLPSPGMANDCGCSDPATPIHDIQGDDTTSDMTGQVRTIQGVVVGDFQNSEYLRGFFLQEEDNDADIYPATSEGIFVYDGLSPDLDVKVGEVVRVMGEVREYFDRTELFNVNVLAVCGTGAASAKTVNLPIANVAHWERYEGMLIDIPQPLYVTEHYLLGRFGEVQLSVNGRLNNPTNVVAPGAQAIALQDLNDRSRIQLDDGIFAERPDPVPYIGSQGTLRIGDTTPGIAGVVHYAYETYEVHPIEPVNFTRVNAREVNPPDVGGTLKVAHFNAFNYFTTLDDSGLICGPVGGMLCRGADNAAEYTRQRDKILNAILAIDADVLSLTELENHLADNALKDLVSGLNNGAGAGTYAFVETGPIGIDAIKAALIYKPAKITPLGLPAVLDSSVDPSFIDSLNRPSLAQTFKENATNEKFTVVVNHLKSKGSSCNSVGDPDLGDGQSNCNQTRTTAAAALVNWLATDPTVSNDPDFLIIGDLNAYAMEDPVAAIKDGGYTDLIKAHIEPENSYSYIFFGQSGYLDHALSSESLTGLVTGVAIWHINADEPSTFNYNDYNHPYLYTADFYRSTDHDPVIIGLDLVPGCDDDGIPDDEDNCPCTENSDQKDTDGDGSGDACDDFPSDPDNDVDGDGIPGYEDNCPGNSNPDQADGDGDGLGDSCDDIQGEDTDGDGVTDDKDLCAEDSEKSAPGVCGCGTADVDSNANGVMDCLLTADLKANIGKQTTLIKSLKKTSGPNRKRNRKRKRALREIKKNIRALASAIFVYITVHQTNIATAKAGTNLVKRANVARRKAKKALRTGSPKFRRLKKRALKAYKKLNAAIVS